MKVVKGQSYERDGVVFVCTSIRKGLAWMVHESPKKHHVIPSPLTEDGRFVSPHWKHLK